MIGKHLDEGHNELNDCSSIGQRTGRGHLFGKHNTPSQQRSKYTEEREGQQLVPSICHVLNSCHHIELQIPAYLPTFNPHQG